MFQYRALHKKEPVAIVDPPEDVYFVHALEILSVHPDVKLPVTWPHRDQAAQFSVEAVYYKDPVGIHGFDKNFLSILELRKLMIGSAIEAYANQTLLKPPKH